MINNKLDNKATSLEEQKIFLDNIITNIRYLVSNTYQEDISNEFVQNKCDLFQYLIGHELEKYPNITVYPKETQNVIYPTCTGHSFLVCIFEKIPYLIDLTYGQFFLNENCDESKFIIKNNQILKAPDPGFFVKDLKVSQEIIDKGYILLTENVAKIYCDSFYYTKTGDNNYVDVPKEIYYKALMKETRDYSLGDDYFFSRYSGKLKYKKNI